MKLIFQGYINKILNAKLLLTVFIICFFQWVEISSISAQTTNNNQSTRESTPIEALDYHLTKDQFLHFYGTDDTARAIINMFYRKRGIGILDFLVLPIGADIVGIAIERLGSSVAFLATGTVISYVGFYGILIYYIIQRSIYSRQNLLYVLVGRERGRPIPKNTLKQLQDFDFH